MPPTAYSICNWTFTNLSVRFPPVRSVIAIQNRRLNFTVFTDPKRKTPITRHTVVF